MLAVDASANSPFYQTAAFLPSASRFQSLLAGTPAMAGRRQTEPHPFEDYSNERSQSERTSTRLTKKRRRWPWFLLLLLVIVFFLPNVIAMTGLKQQAIDYALTDFNGRVTVKSASFGWLQPITLQQIEAVDTAGQPLATIEELKTSRSLISFLTSSDYGTCLLYTSPSPRDRG